MKDFIHRIPLRQRILICLFCVVLLAGLSGVVIHSGMYSTRYVSVSDWLLDEDSAVNFCLDFCELDTHEAQISPAKNGLHSTITYDGNGAQYIKIQGWAFLPGQSVKTVDSHILLRESGTERYLQLKTTLQNRPDVTDTYGGGQFDLDHSGLLAVVNRRDLKAGQIYDVFIAYGNDDNRYLVDTNEHITA